MKQRRESLTLYRSAERGELAAKEQRELDVIADYMPPALSETELDELIAAALKETGGRDSRDMGKVMGWIKPKVSGRADMGTVSNKVKTALSG